MATLLYRLGRWSADHAWRVLAAWIVVLATLGGLAAAFSTPATTVVNIPDAKFAAVLDRMEERVPGVTGTTGTAVFTTDDGTPFTAEQRTAIDGVLAQWEKAPHVQDVVDPFDSQRRLDQAGRKLAAGEDRLAEGEAQWEQGHQRLQKAKNWRNLIQSEVDEQRPQHPNSPAVVRGEQDLETLDTQIADGERKLANAREKLDDGQRQVDEGRALADGADAIRFVSEDGSAALSQIGFDLDPQSMSLEDRHQLITDAERLQDVGVHAYFGNEITHEDSVVGVGEIVGLVIAAIVLVVMLGSLLAAGLPLVVAVLGVAVALAGTLAATHFFDMHSMTPALALMLGLAVGIDYTLFIVNRHRTQLLGGMDLHESVGRAVGTAGNAVGFAGTTVVVALVALVLSGMPILAQMGLVAAVAVATAVLMALTLAPALLGIVGHRVLSRRAWRKAKTRAASQEEEHGGWYVGLVTRRPWLTIALVVGVVGLIAWPMTQLRLGLPDGSSEDPGSSAHTAYTTVAGDFGPGMNGPVIVLADLPGDPTAAQARAQTARLSRLIMEYPGVSGVLPVGASDDNRTQALQVVLDSGPTDEATTDTVAELMTGLPQNAQGVDVGLTGRTVANIEISEKLSSKLPPYLAVVVGLSLLILMAVFRSVVVPLIATGGFLLSVGAAFGATVAVYQWGWLGSLFNVHTPGPLMSFGPILLIGVLFGLAMDYQMFLVSGMREAHAHGEDSRTAVRTGFTHGAKVVTAAAAIMFAVFGGFVFSHMVMIRPIGFGLAVGVLVDAVLVRMTLTPALMHVLGDSAWWMPRWLDRLLPDFDVEGTTLTARLDEQRASAPSAERELVDA